MTLGQFFKQNPIFEVAVKLVQNRFVEDFGISFFTYNFVIFQDQSTLLYNFAFINISYL